MSNILEFTLRVRDQISQALEKVGIKSDSVSGKVSKLTEATQKLGNQFSEVASKEVPSFTDKLDDIGSTIDNLKTTLIGVGAAAGISKLFDFASEGANKINELHDAQQELANTMGAMGGLSEKAYATLTKGAEALSQKTEFSTTDITRLQTQLQQTGNIGADNLLKVSGASADIAKKFKLNLSDAGNVLTDATSNKEALDQFGKMFQVPQSALDKIKQLGDNGQKTAAQMELVKIVEDKIGGAAEQAFNADPVAQFTKDMDNVKLKAGEFYLDIKNALMPALNAVTSLFKGIYNTAYEAFTWVFDKIREGNPLIITLVGLLATATLTLLIYQGGIVAYQGVVKGITVLTKAWTIAQELLTGALEMNPIGLIISAIVALIAVIGYVVYKTDGWKETWRGLVTYIRATTFGMGNYIKLQWLEVSNWVLTQIENVKVGWMGLKSMWNRTPIDMAKIKAIQEDRKQRENEIKYTTEKVKKYATVMVNTKVNHLKWNSQKSLSDMPKSIMSSLGITPPSIPGTGTTGTGVGAGSTAGGGTGKAGGKTNTQAKDTAKNIATGGTKSTNITVNVAGMGNNMKVYVSNLQEGAQKIQDIVLDSLSRSLDMAQGLATD